MKSIKQTVAILTICLFGSIAFAASVLEMPNQPFSGLSSDTTVINDWNSISKQLSSAYGGTVLEISDPGELAKLSADISTPIAYTADLGAISLFNVMNQTIPEAMRIKLLEVFKDLEVSDFEEYNFGMNIVATKGGGGNYSVRAILLKSKDASQKITSAASGQSFTLDEATTLKLPEGTTILTEKKKTEDDATLELYRMQIETSSKDFRDFVTEKLSESNVAYQEKKIGAITTIIIDAENARAQLNFETDAPASKTSTVSLSIYRYN
jgi:hypothetical protein